MKISLHFKSEPLYLAFNYKVALGVLFTKVMNQWKFVIVFFIVLFSLYVHYGCKILFQICITMFQNFFFFIKY